MLLRVLDIGEGCTSRWMIPMDVEGEGGLVASFGKEWRVQECEGTRTTYLEVDLVCRHNHIHGSRIYQLLEGDRWLFLEEVVSGQVCPICAEKPRSIGCPRCRPYERHLQLNVNHHKDPFCPGCGTAFK